MAVNHKSDTLNYICKIKPWIRYKFIIIYDIKYVQTNSFINLVSEKENEVETK